MNPVPHDRTHHEQPKRLMATSLPQISAYIAESAVRLLLTAVVGVFIARYLGPADLGLLSFATGVFALVVPLTNLGMRSILLRDFSIERDWRPLLISSLSRQAPAALAASILGVCIFVLARGTEVDVVPLAIALAPLPLLSLSDSFRALFESKGYALRIAIVAIASTLATSIAAFLAIALGAPTWVFGFLVTAEAGLIALGLLWDHLQRGVLKSARKHYSPEVAKRLMSESWPLLIGAFAVTVYMKIDTTMLGILADDFETGVYAAAARLSQAWYFLPVAAAAALRPRLARLFGASQFEEYETLTQRFITAAFMTAALVAAVVSAAAMPMVDFIYGSNFISASGVLRVHVLAAPFVFMGVASSQWFIDHRMTKAVMRRSSVAALLNVTLNFLLIPLAGAYGAAIATLVAQASSGFFLNAVSRSTQPLFRMQLRALRGAWR